MTFPLGSLAISLFGTYAPKPINFLCLRITTSGFISVYNAFLRLLHTLVSFHSKFLLGKMTKQSFFIIPQLPMRDWISVTIYYPMELNPIFNILSAIPILKYFNGCEISYNDKVI